MTAIRGGRTASQVAVRRRPPHAPAVPACRVGSSPADQAAEIARLRKELERTRMERDIIRRAALIVGQATDGR